MTKLSLEMAERRRDAARQTEMLMTTTTTEGATKRILDEFDSLAKTRAVSTGESYSQAYAAVMTENPELYQSYLVAGGFVPRPRAQ